MKSTTKRFNDINNPGFETKPLDLGSLQAGNKITMKNINKLNDILGTRTETGSYAKQRSGGPTTNKRTFQKKRTFSEDTNLSEDLIDFFEKFRLSIFGMYPEDGPVTEQVIKVIEDLVCLLVQVYALERTTDRFLATLNFFKFRSKKPLTPSFISMIKKLLEDISEEKYQIHYELQEGSEVDDEQDTPLQNVTGTRNLLDNWDRLEESPIAEKLRLFMGYCMAFSLLETFGLPSTFSTLVYNEFNVKREKPKVSGFIYSMIDVLEFILTRIKTCYDTGSLKPMFHCSDSYILWYDQVQKLEFWSTILDCPEIEGFTEHQYIKQLEDCIEFGEQMVSLAKKSTSRIKLNTTVNRLKKLKSDFQVRKRASQTRNLPFAVLLAGGTGIGKTYITYMCMDYFSKIRNLPNANEYTYLRCTKDEFMSGFSSQVLYVIIDDIAYMNPNVAVGGDPSVMEMLQMINVAPYTTNQAELEKKGKVPFMPEFVIASTNTRTLNVDKYFSFPSAVQRRLPFIITPKVKPEYQSEVTSMMDSSKVPDFSSESYCDYWFWDVHEIVPQPVAARGEAKKVLATERVVLQDANLKDFLKWYRGVVIKHYDNQMKLKKNIALIKEVLVCNNSKLPLPLCDECSIDDNDGKRLCEAQPLLKDIQLQSGSECNGWGPPPRRPPPLKLVAYPPCLACGHVCYLGKKQCPISACMTCKICIYPDDVRLGSCLECCSDGPFKCLYCLQDITITNTEFNSCYACRDMYFEQLVDLNSFEFQSGTIISPFVTRNDILIAIFSKSKSFVGFLFNFLALYYFTVYYYLYSKCTGFKPIGYYNRIKSLKRVKDAEVDYCTSLKDEISELGEQAEKFLGQRPFAKIAGALLAGIILIKISVKMVTKYRNRKSIQGGSVFKDGSENRPSPQVSEGINPWKKEIYKLSPCDTTALTKSYNALPREQFISIIYNNLAAIRVRKSETSYVPANMFCICDRYYAINTHSVPDEDEFYIDILFDQDEKGVKRNMSRVAIGRNQVTKLSGDFSIIFIPQLRPRKNLRKLFPFRTLNVRTDGYYIHRQDSGKGQILPVENLFKTTLEDMIVEGKVDAFRGFVETPTQKGFCGSMLIVQTSHGPAFGGMHYMGSRDGSVLSFVICQEDLDDFFSNKIVIDEGYVELSCSKNSLELQGLHDKSPIRYIEAGVAECYGSLNNCRSKPKSGVCHTLVHDYWQKTRNIPDTHGPPLMSGYLPWRNGLIPMVQDNFSLSWDRLKRVSNGYLDDIISALPLEEARLLEIYDFETCLNGCPGVQYVDKIDFTTSAGFPYFTSKKYLTTPRLDEEGRDTGFVDAGPEIIENFNSIIERYKRGERANPVFTMSCKDEPRAFDKIEKGATRLFAGSPFAFTLVTRRYCASFVRVIQRNRLIFECAVGVNPHSEDWDKITTFLKWFGDDLFDGDYKNYDKTMMSMIIYAAALIPYKLIRHYNYDLAKKHEKEYFCLATDIAYSWVNFNGDLFSFFRNNPSGHALTVIINCIVNSFYFRLAFLKNKPPDVSIKDFQKYVKLVTYGDDFVAGINSELSPWFNFDSVRKAMLDFGVVLTRADKLEGTYKYKTLSEVDFLKRRFVFDNRLNRYVAPLAIKSIEKSLMIHLRSKTVSPQVQAVSSMSSALREMFFHGEQQFEEFREQIMNCIEFYKLQNYVGLSDFPIHSELLNYYRSSNITYYKQQEFSYLDDTLLELQGSCLSRSKRFAEDKIMRQKLRFYSGRVVGDKTHPKQVVPIRPNHYQGVGIKGGQLCLVEYISQKAYIGDSYCWNHIPSLCENFSERGLSIHFHMGDPHSPYLRTERSDLKARDWGETENYWPPFRQRTNISKQSKFTI